MRSLFFLGVMLLIVSVVETRAQIPKQLSYQGVLTDTVGNPQPDGNYVMTFRLYDVENGGSALWSEAKNVNVQGGFFSTYLGDTTPFPDSISWTTGYWLGIQIDLFPELSPRVKLASSAYSLGGGGNTAWQDTNGVLYYGGGRVFIGRTFPISGNEVFGMRYNGGANDYGGMYVETSNAQGWPFYGYATNGSFRAWTYYDGTQNKWHLYKSGLKLTVSDTVTLRIAGATSRSLELANSTGSDGIRINETGDDGIQVGASPDYPNYGLYIPSPGVTAYGLWPNTENASGQWALYTVDNIEAGNVFASAYTLIAKVDGSEPLTKGDVAAASGLAQPIPGGTASLSLVRLADDSRSAGIVGVVQSRMVWAVAPGKEAEGEMSLQGAEGPAQPGDYVALTIAGVAQVKVDGSLPIVAGQRLTTARAGHARALQTRTIEGMTVSEGGPVIGVALAPSNGSGTIPVHITIR